MNVLIVERNQSTTTANTTSFAVEGWDYTNQLQQARKNGLNKKLEPPTVTLSSISYSGLATLTFQQIMVVPPMHLLQNTTFAVKNYNYSATQPSI